MPTSNPKLLVTGCARSGTQYLATLLNNCGIPCGRESIYHPNTTSASREAGWVKFTAESSWMSAKYLTSLPPNTFILHLHRHPQLVVRSHLELGFFLNQPRPSRIPYLKIAKTVIPNYADCDPALRAERYWLHWNKLIEGSTNGRPNVCRMSLAGINAESISEVLAQAQLGISRDVIEQAFQRTPARVNTKLRDKLTTLAARPLQEAATMTMMLNYGYQPIDSPNRIDPLHH